MVEGMRAQARVQVVHEHDVRGVVEARALGQQARLAHDFLGVLVALLGEGDRVHLEVDPVVALALLVLLRGELGDERVDAPVELGGILGLPGNDERGSRFVNQDRVDLVDDRVVQRPLEALAHRRRHVVAQVVEAELVVGPVGDVGAVGLLLLGRIHLRHHDADGEAEEAMDAPHPFGVALGEVVVHRDDVHALALERIQVRGQRGDQRLALAGAHLRDLALVQRDAADQLHVEVPHPQHPLRGLAHHRESLGQHAIEWRAGRDLRLQLGSLGDKLGVGKSLHPRLERVDRLDGAAELLEEAVVAAAEDGLDCGVEHGGLGVRKCENRPVAGRQT